MYAGLDPRVKMLQLVVLSLCIFATRSIAAQVAISVAVAAVAVADRQRARAVWFLVLIALLTALLVAPLARVSGPALIYARFIVFFALKFAPAVLFMAVLCAAEDVSRFIHGLERLRVPRQLTLPLAVAIRFAPSLTYEYSCIKDAMRLRGIQPTFAGFYRHPIRTVEYLSVPLLMRSLKIADELSASALTRGIDVGGRRAHYQPLVFTRRDAVALGVSVFVGAAILWLDVLAVR